ncbi:MAG: hypothetical protein ACRDJ3_00490 [Solirubrobacteraceae bacterium]
MDSESIGYIVGNILAGHQASEGEVLEQLQALAAQLKGVRNAVRRLAIAIENASES